MDKLIELYGTPSSTTLNLHLQRLDTLYDITRPMAEHITKYHEAITFLTKAGVPPQPFAVYEQFKASILKTAYSDYDSVFRVYEDETIAAQRTLATIIPKIEQRA